jgi:PHD/YefM family antitoxin component YafN of YafNO toxin-antitoxin module
MNYKKEMIIRYNKESNTINSVLKNKDLMEIINHKKQIILTKTRNVLRMYDIAINNLYTGLIDSINRNCSRGHSYLHYHIYKGLYKYVPTTRPYLWIYNYLIYKFKKTNKNYLMSKILFDWRENRLCDIYMDGSTEEKVELVYKELDLDRVINYYTIFSNNYYKLKKENNKETVFVGITNNENSTILIDLTNKNEIRLNDRRDRTQQGLVDKIGTLIKEQLRIYIDNLNYNPFVVYDDDNGYFLTVPLYRIFRITLM